MDSNFLSHTHIDVQVLENWVEAGWLSPRKETDRGGLSDLDFARALLILDLQKNMGVNDEGIAIILDLLDQIHGLRRKLREIISAAARQSKELPNTGRDLVGQNSCRGR
jgi:chaperone modulatory protein CbpM